MHETEEPVLTGSYEELARLVGCESAEVARCVAELKRTNTADVTLGNGFVTLVSRRLKRELSDREKTRLRVQRHRCNADVTVQSKSKSNKKEKEEEREPLSAASPRGTRIADPFNLTPDMRAWAKEKRPLVDLVLETEKFVNYWRAKAGRDGVKLDWTATWRNWILNSKDSTTIRPTVGKSTTVTDDVPFIPATCAVCGQDQCKTEHSFQEICEAIDIAA